MRQILYGCLFLLLPSAGWAQTAKVEIDAPRAFGYFVGDVIRHNVEITAPEGYELLSASVPAKGPLTYWLELVDVKLDQSASGREKRYRLHLTYQNFYVALDARPMEIPPFTLAFADKAGASRVETTVPAWSFEVSPLREVQPAVKEAPEGYLKADIAPSLNDLSRARWNVLLFALATAAAFTLLAYHSAWLPFRGRQGRPLTNASRKIREDLGPEGKPGLYQGALLALHRALDETDGRRVFADDLPGFLSRHPAFRSEENGLTRFFACSRKAFFGNDPSEAEANLPPADLITIAERLASAERGAP